MPCASDLMDNAWHIGFYFQKVSKQTPRFNLWPINISSRDTARPQASQIVHSFVWIAYYFVPTHSPSLKVYRPGGRGSVSQTAWRRAGTWAGSLLFFFCCEFFLFFFPFFFFLVLNPGKNNMHVLSSCTSSALLAWGGGGRVTNSSLCNCTEKSSSTFPTSSSTSLQLICWSPRMLLRRGEE